jgi:mono/diheme cytochrome c family protein
VRPVLATTAAAVVSLALGACGTEGISVPKGDSGHAGAVLFAERCAGCHTLTPAGPQGSANRAIRAQGPNLDQRQETYKDVIFAIRNGGFSGAIMPQNIVTGVDASKDAKFVSEYAGQAAGESPQPGSTTGSK